MEKCSPVGSSTGGKLEASGLVSSDRMTIHTSGSSMTTAIGASTRCQPLNGSRPRLGGGSSIARKRSPAMGAVVAMTRSPYEV